MLFSRMAVAFVVFGGAVAEGGAALMLRKLAKGTLYFNQDDNGVKDDKGHIVPLASWPNSNATYQAFCSADEGLTMVTESFESVAQNTPPIDIGDGQITGVMDSVQKNRGIKVLGKLTGKDLDGLYATDGDYFLFMPTGSRAMLNFTNSGPIVGIGFFATDMLDKTRNREVSIATYDADGKRNKKMYKPKVLTPGAQSNAGAVSFVAIYDPEGFNVVEIGNMRGDSFGMDNLVMLKVSEDTEALSDPIPTGEALSSASDVCGVTLAPYTTYVFQNHITCSGSSGPTLWDNTRVYGAGFSLFGSGTANGMHVPSDAVGAVIENVVIDGFENAFLIEGSDVAISNVRAINNVRIGLKNQGGDNNRLECSVVSGNDYGVYVFSGGLTMTGTLIQSSGTGGLWHDEGPLAVSCSEIRVSGETGIDSVADFGSINVQDSIVIDSTPYGFTSIGVADITLGNVVVCGSGDADFNFFLSSFETLDALTCDAASNGVTCESTCPADLAAVTVPEDACADVCVNGRGTY